MRNAMSIGDELGLDVVDPRIAKNPKIIVNRLMKMPNDQA